MQGRVLLTAALSCAFGCENTPIDAVVADDLRLDGGTEVGDGATCTSTRADPGPGIHRIFSASSGRCLGAGDPTTVLGQPALTTRMSTECGSERELWELVETSFGDTLRMRNVAEDLYLDVERGSTQSGTRAILYGMNSFQNQIFGFRPRPNGEHEIAPNHVDTSCLTEYLNSVVIWPCSPTDTRQNWETFAVSCP
jgi:hypothetical protein